jgi:hypothetical protein
MNSTTTHTVLVVTVDGCLCWRLSVAPQAPCNAGTPTATLAYELVLSLLPGPVDPAEIAE